MRPMLCSDERLGETPEGFPTQRAALEGEDQLQWAGGFSSHTSLLPQWDPLVRTLGVILAVNLHMRGCVVFRSFFVADRSFGFDLVNYFVSEVMVLSYTNYFREWWEGEFILEDERRKDRRSNGGSRAW